MGLSTVTVLTSVLVLYLHHRGSVMRVPGWLRFAAFRVISRMLCMHLPPLRLIMKELRAEQAKHAFLGDQKTSKQSKDVASNMEMSLLDDDSKEKPSKETAGADTADDCPPFLRQLRVEISNLTGELKVLTNGIRKKEEDKLISEEWQAVARVIDRLLFWIVLIILVSSLIWLLFESFREYELDLM